MRIKGNLFTKKKLRTPKRNARLKLQLSKSLRFKNQIQYHKVVQYSTSSQLNSGSTTPQQFQFRIQNLWQPTWEYQGIVFSLSQVPNSLEFVNLYDVFKIRLIKFELYPEYNINQYNETEDIITTAPPADYTRTFFPGIHSVIDYNSADTTALVPTNPFQQSIQNLLQYGTYKYSRGGKIHKRIFRPRMQLATNEGGTPVNVAEDKSRWLNTNSGSETNPMASNVPHYGLKVMSDPIDLGTAGDPPTKVMPFIVKVTYYLAFKNTK